MDPSAIGPIATLGFLVLVALVMVPLIAMQLRRAGNRTSAYVQGPTRTGLRRVSATAHHYAGTYRGYPASIRHHLEMPNTGMVYRGDRQSTSFHYQFELTVPGRRFPLVEIVEQHWWSALGDERVRRPTAPPLFSGIPGCPSSLHVFGHDPRLASAIVASPAVRAFLASFPGMNLRVHGESISFHLVLRTPMQMGPFSDAHVMAWEFAVPALDGLVATAEAASYAA